VQIEGEVVRDIHAAMAAHVDDGVVDKFPPARQAQENPPA